MNLWQTVIYWASMVMLWIILGLNIWTGRRSYRDMKKWRKNLEETEKVRREYETLRNTYVKLLDEQQERKD